MTCDLIRLSALLDDAKCFDLIRQHRWPDGARCPSCDSGHVVRNGWDDARHARQRWLCKGCKARFDDLTGTVLAGHHQPLRVWVLCLYFMGLNLSNHQIAQELDLNKDDIHQMTGQLRQGIVWRQKPTPILHDSQWNVMRSTSSRGIRVSRMRSQKRASRGRRSASQRQARPRDT